MATFLTSESLAVAVSDMGIPAPVQLMVLVMAVILANRPLAP